MRQIFIDHADILKETTLSFKHQVIESVVKIHYFMIHVLKLLGRQIIACEPAIKHLSGFICCHCLIPGVQVEEMALMKLLKPDKEHPHHRTMELFSTKNSQLVSVHVCLC